MKRMLGLIGLTYLSFLALVFYFFNNILLCAFSAVSVFVLLVGIFFKVIKNKSNIVNYLLILGATVLCACVSIILYTNIVYQPAVNNYSNKEINVSGYVCEEVQKTEQSSTYTILADEINGKSDNVKILVYSYRDLNLSEFERIEAKLYTYKTENNYNLSKGIFLSAYADEDTVIEKTGETQFSLNRYAIKARKSMKYSLDSLLPDSYSSLCKAILLGDKQALPADIKGYFSLTGTTFLIVVSGMHLSIISAFILFLVKKIVKNKIIICISICITVFLFMALTGFTPSVIRAGVMVILTYCASVIFRQADAINSLGISALVLTVFNPYSVGDIGMMLSFVATFGIILWAYPMYFYIVNRLGLKNRIVKTAVNMATVSLSASLWVLPISIVAFGKVSPFVMIFSFLSENLVSGILICALLASFLYLCPVISFTAYPFALVAGLFSKFLLRMMSLFASIPYCSVNADKIYFYVWIGVAILLVIIGYIIHAKYFYIKCSIAFSTVTLIVGWTIFAIVGYNSTTVNIYNCGYGVTATIESGYNITVLSCGGSVQYEYEVVEDISSDFTSIDNIIIPNQKNKYTKFLPVFLSEFDVSNVLVYDKNSENQAMLQNYDGYRRNTFSSNSSFVVNVNSTTTDEVINIDEITYQYVKSDNSSLLFVPTGGDIAKLPEKYRKADILLTDTVPENYQLLDCAEIVYSGSEDYFNKNINSLKEITDDIITVFSGKTQIKF